MARAGTEVRMFARLFLDHPDSVGESYREHAGVAARFGGSMVLAGLACLVHAVVPGLFVRTASETVERLHARMHRRRAPTRASVRPSGDWSLTYEI